jgi:flagellar hook-basal body protein
MNQALWIAKTGLDAQQTRMEVVSNNIANVNTTGFKRERAVFEDMLYQNVRQVGANSTQDTQLPSGFSLGTGVRVVATEKLHSQGNLVNTDNPFDLAVQGKGFFQILMPDGSLAYTRDGSFQIDRDGQLVTSSGYQVQPSITVPEGALSVTIGADADRQPAADRLHQSGRPAGSRPEPADRVRFQRRAADRHAGPQRPGHADAGRGRELQRQRRRGIGQHDRDAARLRDELKGHPERRSDDAVRDQQPVTG